MPFVQQQGSASRIPQELKHRLSQIFSNVTIKKRNIVHIKYSNSLVTSSKIHAKTSYVTRIIRHSVLPITTLAIIHHSDITYPFPNLMFVINIYSYIRLHLHVSHKSVTEHLHQHHPLSAIDHKISFVAWYQANNARHNPLHFAITQTHTPQTIRTHHVQQSSVHSIA